MLSDREINRAVGNCATSYSKGGGLPTTQLFFSLSTCSTRLTHLSRDLRLSWLTWTYPVGSKCFMKNEVLPNEGIPQNSTISRCPSDGTMGVEVGVTRGTTTTLSIYH